MIHRFLPAGIALAIASLAIPLAAQTPPAAPPKRGFARAGEDYKHYSQETLDSGQKYYTANCAFCHGGGAKGGESGPDLLRSVFVLHDENGESIGGFIKVGRPDKGMPKFNLPDDQVRDIAAFIHDRVRQAAERSGYQIQNIVVGDAKAGEAYFNGAGGCTSCHSTEKDLAHVATKYPQPVDLQQKIVMPRAGRGNSGGPGTAITVKITEPSGETMEGKLVRMDDFSVTFLTESGDRKTIERTSEDIPKVEVHDPMKGHLEILARISDSDIHNLTAYLMGLK